MGAHMATNPISLQQLRNASEDAQDLEHYVNDDVPALIPTRIGGQKPNYAKLVADFQNSVQTILADTEQESNDAIDRMTSFVDRGVWQPATVYERKDVVTVDGIAYITLEGHTSSASFENDLAAGLWQVFQGVNRAELADDSGAALVGFKQSGAKAALRTALDKMREAFSATDYTVDPSGSTNSSAAFTDLEEDHEGRLVDLLGGVYLVDAEPRGNTYFNGCFLVGGEYIYKDTKPYDTPFGKAGIQSLDASYDAHYGFNSGMGESQDGATNLRTYIYRRGAGHALSAGAQVMAADSFDKGRTLVNRRVIYQDPTYDVRNWVTGTMGDGRLGTIAQRRTTAGDFAWPVFIYSDDPARKVWNSVVIEIPPGVPTTFHGSLVPWPASVGGHDLYGWIAYCYDVGDGRIGALYTLDNGATWAFKDDVAIPDGTISSGLVYYLQEMAVARVGTQNRWVMVLRNIGGTTGSNSNAVAYASSDPLNFGAEPIDTGLMLKGNPPQLIYESGRLWFFAFSRRAQEIMPGIGSHLLVADAPANALFLAGGNFSALRSGWKVVTSLPDWASGYMAPYRFNGRWFASFVTQEQDPRGTNGPKRSLLCEIGDFIPVTLGLRDVGGPARNELMNSGFDIAQRGTSFSASSATFLLTTDRWGVAAAGGETLNAQRIAFPDGQAEVPGNPRYFMRYSGTAAAGNHFFGQRIEGVRRLSGSRVSVRVWLRGVGGTVVLPFVRAIQVFGTGGAPSSQVTTVVAQNVTVTPTWSSFEWTFNLPSVEGKSFGTNNNDYLYFNFYLPAGTRTLDFATPKLENSGYPTAWVRPHVGDELRRCRRYFDSTYSEGIAPGTASNAGGALQERARGTEGTNSINLNARWASGMRASPSVRIYSPLTGVLGAMEDVTAGADITASSTNVGTAGAVVGNTAVTVAGNTYRAHVTADAEI